MEVGCKAGGVNDALCVRFHRRESAKPAADAADDSDQLI